MRLILASGSPRRKQILALLGIPFETIPSGLAENPDPGRTASEEALHLACAKARAVAAVNPDAVVIGCDTLIDLQGLKVGKPADPQEALTFLKKLSGQEHSVVTALAVVSPGGKTETFIETSRVRMKKSAPEVLENYAASPEPLDKAGAYSIQGEGGRLIGGIQGDFLSVVGLPLRALARILRIEGIDLPVEVESIYREKAFENWRRFDP